MPHITFTSPEVAQIGLTETKAREKFKSNDLLVKSFDINKVDRAVNEDDRLGLIKIVARGNGTHPGRQHRRRKGWGDHH